MHLMGSNERLPVKNAAHTNGRCIDEYARLINEVIDLDETMCLNVSAAAIDVCFGHLSGEDKRSTLCPIGDEHARLINEVIDLDETMCLNVSAAAIDVCFGHLSGEDKRSTLCPIGDEHASSGNE